MPTQADNSLVRVQNIKTYDDEPQQKVTADARYSERYGGQTGKTATPRIQNYGFTSHVPVGSQGITTTMDGNPDKAMIVGLEHPDHRPKNLNEGEWKLYEKWGGYDYAQESKWIRKVGTATIECFRDGRVHINRSGAS